MKKKVNKHFLRSIVTLICCFSMLLTVIGTAAVPAAAVSGNSVTASGSTTLKQGSSGYCYIYIDSLEELSSLNVEVHFDPTKVKVTSTYNSVSCTLQDSVINQDSINYSYIFDGNGSASKTRLFYFYYTVLSDAAVGDTYFDIVITDAYDASLNTVDVSGSRYKLDITEKTVSKSTSVSCSSSINTSVKEEFELSYRVGTNQIASGSFVINYDPELFEVISVTNGAFLDGKFTDVNTDLSGSVYVSFVGTEYNYNYDLLKVKFRTLKNKATASDIKLTVTEFCDLELNNYSCTGCTTKANIAYDPTYTEDAPAMTLTPTYDASTSKVTAVIQLDKDSHLGAGDFTVNFDASKLTYVSSEKGFTPSFFNINDKNVASGELKFSIISMSDIVAAETVLTLTFEAEQSEDAVNTDIILSGTGLADSLTNSILLNFVSSPLTIPAKAPFTLYGANASLKENLIMYFYVPMTELDGTDYYAKITRTYADGKADDVRMIPCSEWTAYTSSLYRFAYPDIAAKEMTDKLTVEIYNSDDKLVSDPWIDSISDYCYRGVTKSTKPTERTMLLDLVNYGAAAQVYFNYNTENLANSWAEEYQSLASSLPEFADERVKGENYYGTSLVMKSKTTLRFYFTNLSTDMYATISFTNNYGHVREYTVQGREFVASGKYHYVDANTLAMGDYNCLVTVKVYDSTGNVVASVTDSISSYLARALSASTDDLYPMAAAAMVGAYNHFHP